MKKRLRAAVTDTVNIYFNCRVHRCAAALSYFLVMTVFPFLICLNFILGTLNLTEESLITAFSDIIPRDALDIISGYIEYVGGNAGKPLLIAGIVVMLTSSSAAFRCIMGTMYDIQGKPRFNGLFGVLFSFVLSIAFLVAVYLSSLIVFSGEWLMKLLETRLGLINVWNVWRWLRFLIMFLLLYGVIFAIYFLSAPKDGARIPRSPGAALAAVLLVGVSIVFSMLITLSANITVVYGSLASVIILMMWLYFCGTILIMGNVINIVGYNFRRSSPKKSGGISETGK